MGASVCIGCLCMFAPGLSLASRGDMSLRLRFGGMHCPSHSPSRLDAIGSPRGPDPGVAKVCRAGPWPCALSVLSTATCPAPCPCLSVVLLPPSCFLPSPAYLSVSPSLPLLLAVLLSPQSGPIQQRSPWLLSPPLPRLAGHLQLRWSAPLVCALLRNGSVNKDVAVICDCIPLT